MLIGSFFVHCEIFLMQLVSCKITVSLGYYSSFSYAIIIVIHIMLQDCSLFLYSRIACVKSLYKISNGTCVKSHTMYISNMKGYLFSHIYSSCCDSRRNELKLQRFSASLGSVKCIVRDHGQLVCNMASFSLYSFEVMKPLKIVITTLDAFVEFKVVKRS